MKDRRYCWKCHLITYHTTDNGIVTCQNCGARARQEHLIPLRCRE